MISRRGDKSRLYECRAALYWKLDECLMERWALLLVRGRDLHYAYM